jgi:aryl-alcohol dehydrogenase-like predicted oxidoreductase
VEPVGAVGAANEDHLQSNVRAVEVDFTEETAVRLQPLVEPPAHYWQTRSNLSWN